MNDLERPKSIGLAPGLPKEAAGQDAAKYNTSNPVVLKLLSRWMKTLHEVIGEATGSVVDVGTGEGYALAKSIPPEIHVSGIEYRHDKAVIASERLRNLSAVQGDAGLLPFPTASADLVTCIEVLEHLEPFQPAVAELARICRGRVVISVPWEPWFRLGNLGRGKNLARLGNDPEHVQSFSPGSLRRSLKGYFEEVYVVKAFPWLIAEASHPRVSSR